MSFPQRFLLSRTTPRSPASTGSSSHPSSPFSCRWEVGTTMTRKHLPSWLTRASRALAASPRATLGAASGPCCSAAAPRQVTLQARLSLQPAESRGRISAALSSRLCSPVSGQRCIWKRNWKYKTLSSSSQGPSASRACPKTVWTVPFSYKVARGLKIFQERLGNTRL